MPFTHSVTKILAIIGFAGLMTACGITYQVGGTFEDSGEPFFGTVFVSAGAGTIDVATRDRQVTCSGASWITQMPSGDTIVGAGGSAEAECTDGRTFKVDFVQKTQLGGDGQGIDSHGNVVKIFFGTTAAYVQSIMDKDMLDRMVQ